MINDPYELTNLAGDPAYAEIEAQLAARLEELKPTDREGPRVLSATVVPVPGKPDQMSVVATITDSGYGDSELRMPVFFIDNMIPGSLKYRMLMDVSDGLFDSSTEVVHGEFTVTSSGWHTIFVRGRDIHGNWGPDCELPVYLPPSITLPTKTGTWKPGTGVRYLGTAITVSDDDYTNGMLDVAFTDYSEPTDVLLIKNEGTGVGQISVVGNDVRYEGASFGTITADGTGGGPLNVQFNSAATTAAVQQLLRRLAYNNTALWPATIPRVIQLVLTDGNGVSSQPAVKTFNVIYNPVIANFGPAAITYSVGGAPTRITTTATVTDADSSNFNGGTLSVQVTNHVESTDLLSIQNVGTGTGLINTSGNQIFVGSILLGTFSGGNGATSLVISLNSNAGALRVQTLLRFIQFSSTSANPSILERRFRVSLTDGTGGTSPTINKGIRFNEPPFIGGFGPNTSYTAGGPAITVSAKANVTDPDSKNFDGGLLTIALTSNAEETDLLSIQNVGTGNGQINTSGNQVFIGSILLGMFTGGSGANPLIISLNANAGPLRVQSLLRAILFSSTLGNPSTSPRIVQVTLSDGDGATSKTVSKSIRVINVNSAPTDIMLDNSSVAENQPGGTTVGTFSAADVDSGETFTYSLVSGTGDDDNAAFTIIDNQLQTAAIFDYETRSSYSILVRVTDSGGLTFDKQFTIIVTDVNEDPV